MSATRPVASTFWRRKWLDLRALALPVTAFWGATFLGLLLFTLVLLSTEIPDPTSAAAVIAGFWLATVGGTALGQFLAILGLRTPWVLAASTASWLAVVALGFSSLVAATQLRGADPIAIVLLLVAFLAPIFFACGYFSLSTHMGMLATFTPIMWFTASILMIAEKQGDVETWRSGDKWAIWSVLTTPMLAAAVILILLYMASRELHRLHLWRYSPRGPDVARNKTTGFLGLIAMPGCGSLAALLLLGVALTIGAAATAPYLWRTGHDDGDGNTTTTDDPNHPALFDGPANGPANQAAQALQEAVRALITLLMAVILALAALLVFGPPLRRMLLLQYLRTPFWPVPPSRRVAQHWRLVEIALGDAGVHRLPGDSAHALAIRGAHEADLLDPESLVNAAEVADRVAFGFGVQADDVMVARRAAEMTYQSVWDDLSEIARWKAMYRLL